LKYGSLLLFVFFILFGSNSISQNACDSIRCKTKSYTLILGYSTSLIGLQTLWYQPYQNGNFHVFNDSKEWHQMDKWGHFYASYHLTQLGRSINCKNKNQSVLNSCSAWMFLALIEVMDGYSSGWGFSISDMAVNTLGATLAILNSNQKAKHSMQLKFSFFPSPYAAQNPKLLGQNITESILKDYNGQTYWLSYTPSLSKWPRWLAISLGYGIDGFINANPVTGKTSRTIRCSLDLNPHYLNTQSPWLKPVKWIFKYVKFPFPTINFNQNKVFLNIN